MQKYKDDNIEIILDKIRLSLDTDRSGLEFVGIEDNIVKVKLTSSCGSCPFSIMKSKMGIEKIIKEQMPGIKEVIAS